MTPLTTPAPLIATTLDEHDNYLSLELLKLYASEEMRGRALLLRMVGQPLPTLATVVGALVRMRN